MDRGEVGVAAEQDKDAAVVPVVQRHAEHRQKAETQSGEPLMLLLPQRREAGAAEQDRRADGEVRTHEHGHGEQQCGAERRREPRAGPPGRDADNSDHAGKEQNCRGRVAEAVRRVLDVDEECRAEQRADRDRDEDQSHGERGPRREISPEQGEHQKRQQQQQRDGSRSSSRRKSGARPRADSASPA